MTLNLGRDPQVTDSNPAILWFRRDLRLGDNPALQAAIDSGRPLLACFLLDETRDEWRSLGGAARWWLHRSLDALQADLARHGLTLFLKRGPAGDLLRGIAGSSGADRIYCNRLPEPAEAAADREIARSLAADGITLEQHDAALLFPPPQPLNGSGAPYKVFSAFWRACLALPEPSGPLPLPGRPRAAACSRTGADRLADWKLLPTAPDWSGGLKAAWSPGEQGARRCLEAFMEGAARTYAADRDLPGKTTTSRLSPHLHWGEISPRALWHAMRTAAASGALGSRHAEKFIAELGWREFSHHLLYHYPTLPTHNMNPRFDAFAWADPDRDRPTGAALRAWQRGRTGYPIVDAGMRELWHSGWMHNRIRMVAASFLVKDLRIDWRHGAAWFWDTLVDADRANNSASWQWVAGCGADAAPFFRIFNPVLQGQKFDADGDYVRHWVPELAGLPDRHLHAPWQAPAEILAGADVRLGDSYPRPVVEHAEARRHALAAFAAIKEAAE